MLEGSQFLERLEDEEVESIQERIGYRDPPVGISLFSGAGGFDLGMTQAGFDVRVMIEYEETACKTLRANMERFDEHTEPEIIQDDIRQVSTKQILDAADVQSGGQASLAAVGFSLLLSAFAWERFRPLTNSLIGLLDLLYQVDRFLGRVLHKLVDNPEGDME